MPKLIPQKPETLVKIFSKFGFIVSKRNPGDHIAMRKPGTPRPVIIPDYRQGVPIFIIKNNLRTAGIPREEYFKALEGI